MHGSIFKNLTATLRMIKFEHSLFALPFALLGAFLAANGLPAPRTMLWIIIAMFGARSAAMTFNRIVDRKIDAANPRTAQRELPLGVIPLPFAWAFLIAALGLFFLAAALLNPLTLKLAPVAAASILIYSYTKRFTALAHVVLGWSLAIAPTAAWIAVRGEIGSPIPLLLSLVVLMWTAGFDVLYACQDAEFDRKSGLHSIPQRFGVANSLRISRLFHVQAFAALVLLFWTTQLGLLALVGVIFTGALLIYQHSLVKPGDLSRLNAAFFTTNAFVSVILFVSFAGAILLR